MERNTAPDEAEIAEIVRGFLALQAGTAAEENRPLRRATHPKGVCVRAVFEVFDIASEREPALAARLAQGIYARPGSYAATVRFANSDPNMNSDWQPDVRSLSFAVELAPSAPAGRAAQATRQDYALQSAPTLPFNDVHAFVVFAQVARATNEAVALGAMPFRDQLVYARTKAAILQQQRQVVRAYQQLRYWSNVPFRHGSEDTVKYSAWPSGVNPERTLEIRNQNCLRDELIRHLNDDASMSTFEFGLQFLDLQNMTYQGLRRDAAFWIDNASIEWPETQSPFHTIARLTLLPRSALSPEEAEAMYIDLTEHSFEDNAPVGKVNRARWYAEAASRKARQGLA
jgi:hypothetical protein